MARSKSRIRVRWADCGPRTRTTSLRVLVLLGTCSAMEAPASVVDTAWAMSGTYGNVTFNVIQNPPNYAVVSLVAGSDVPVLPIFTDNSGPLAGTGTTASARNQLTRGSAEPADRLHAVLVRID